MSSKKKSYSKNGCRECKRRKIKCDETKPECLQCTRLDKVCVYPKAGEKVLRVSKKFLMENGVKDVQPTVQPAMQRSVNTALHTGVQTHTQMPPAHTIQSDGPGPLAQPQGRHQMMLGQIPPGQGNPVGQLSPGQGSQGVGQGQSQVQGQGVPGQGYQKMFPVYYNYRNYGYSGYNSGWPDVVSTNAGHNAGHNGGTNSGHNGPNLGHNGASGNAPNSTNPPNSVHNSVNPVNHNIPEIHTYPTTPGAISGVGTPIGGIGSVGTNVSGGTDLGTDLGTSGSAISGGEISGGTVIDHSNTPINSSGGLNRAGIDTGLNTGAIDVLDSYFSREDLNILASDLNNLVGTIMFESNFSVDEELASSESSTTFDKTISPPSIPIIKSIHSRINDEGGRLPKNVPFDFIKVNSTHEKYYLGQFYHDFASVILPFMPYDGAVGGYYNPARDILFMAASKEPFLLAAMLAQGAKTSHTKNNSPQDEEAYCKYLSRCLKLLGPALNKKTESLTSDIESVLLTVLLLTSANASNIKQDWRPHLKGAKDLLLKYTSHANFRQSKVLIFAKAWYLSFEVLAGLSSQRGGTLRNHELDLLMKLDDPVEVETLKEIGIIMPNGFNYFFGFHHELLPTIKDLIKFLSSTRGVGVGLGVGLGVGVVVGAGTNTGRIGGSTTNTTSTPNVSTKTTTKNTTKSTTASKTTGETRGINGILETLSSFTQFSKFQFVHPKYILTPEEAAKLRSGYLLDPQKSTTKDIIINWIDLSHVAYSLAGIITILTRAFGLSCDHEQVRPITSRLINLVSFLEDLPNPNFIKWAQLMIQWPMLIAGLNCTSAAQLGVVERFFQISGSGSASFSLKIINKLWAKRNGEDVSDSDLEIDLVTY